MAAADGELVEHSAGSLEPILGGRGVQPADGFDGLAGFGGPGGAVGRIGHRSGLFDGFGHDGGGGDGDGGDGGNPTGFGAPRQVLQPAVRRAYDQTKGAILDGALPVGAWVTEGQVADALAISRTPVREAFLRLEAEGLLRLYPRRGAMVAELTEQDVADVLELRELIESYAAWRAVEATAEQRRDLVARLRQLAEHEREAWLRGDAVATSRAGRALHAAIVHAAGNKLLDTFYRMLRDRQQRVAIEAVRRQPDRLPTVLAEHSHLVDLLDRGDVGGYELALQRHLAGTRLALAGR